MLLQQCNAEKNAGVRCTTQLFLIAGTFLGTCLLFMHHSYWQGVYESYCTGCACKRNTYICAARQVNYGKHSFKVHSTLCLVLMLQHIATPPHWPDARILLDVHGLAVNIHSTYTWCMLTMLLLLHLGSQLSTQAYATACCPADLGRLLHPSQHMACDVRALG
jgi:hypothetical protein